MIHLHLLISFCLRTPNSNGVDNDSTVLRVNLFGYQCLIQNVLLYIEYLCAAAQALSHVRFFGRQSGEALLV